MLTNTNATNTTNHFSFQTTTVPFQQPTINALPWADEQDLAVFWYQSQWSQMFHLSQTTILCDPYCTLPMWQTYAGRPSDQAVPRVSKLYGVSKFREFSSEKNPTFIGYITIRSWCCLSSFGPTGLYKEDEHTERKKRKLNTVYFRFIVCLVIFDGKDKRCFVIWKINCVEYLIHFLFIMTHGPKSLERISCYSVYSPLAKDILNTYALVYSYKMY